jgi:hypothetical protein
MIEAVHVKSKFLALENGREVTTKLAGERRGAVETNARCSKK